MDLKQYVSEVQDWPTPGVNFKDITTIMDNGEAYGYATDQIVDYAKNRNVDLVVGPVSYTHLRLPTNTVTCRSRWSPYH